MFHFQLSIKILWKFKLTYNIVWPRITQRLCRTLVVTKATWYAVAMAFHYLYFNFNFEQVLSSTVANCFKSYREHTGTTDTQSTELFCRMFDKFFDCLNVRTVNGGTRHQKETIKEYRDATDPRFTVSGFK